MESRSDDSWEDELRSYILQHGDDLEFTKYFWKGCEPIETDIIQYWKFASALRLLNQGLSDECVCESTFSSKSTVYTWKTLTQLPKLAHYLRSYQDLGRPPEELRWMTLECSRGYGVPIGKFVAVPLEIRSWEQVSGVLTQLPDLNETRTKYSREFMMGFLSGILMGDAAKSKSPRGSSHRHIGLVLSKKYETNLKIGEFTAVCARSVGLRMHRTEDLAKPAAKPNGFYEWISQSSPLVDWLFNVALGLRDGELTTYDSVRADWMVDAPRDFRVGLIQGIAESDGSVNVASQVVEFWVDPHRDLLRRLLEREGLRAFNNRQALTLSKSQAIRSFGVPIFNPDLRTARYRRHEIMAAARRLARNERLPEELKDEIAALIRSGYTVPQTVYKIAEERGILLSFEAVQRWAGRARSVKTESHGGERRENHRNNC